MASPPEKPVSKLVSLLKRYVKDLLRFRNKLGESDGLIAEDFVCNFLEFGTWFDVPSLHVYVQDGPKRNALIDYLFRTEEYEIRVEQSSASVSGRPFILERPSFPDLCIIIKATSGPPIIEIINSAMTTLDLCFMSWSKDYSLLPLLTVVNHKFYPLKPLDNELGEVLNRLSQYSWTSRDMLWPDLTEKFKPRKECHQVGGSSSLVIKLRGEFPSHCTPDYILDGSVYAVVSDWDYDHTRRLSVHTNGANGHTCKAWEKYLEQWLERWIYVELVKLGREDRPPGFYFTAPGDYRVSIPSAWKPTEGIAWDYADDQVTTWFKEWDKY
ncbi:hypothetical protein F53441_11109 [Fusarium austroafricanum]|uniref:Uncharacterized protein n=1 Tax=Fusarium austroafricanum TaxID=2364996 RepID=A0A8H4K6Z6_9HYPO|nr:hypothetical protein F53441_11109 [Fusarium austroafricanum]